MADKQRVRLPNGDLAIFPAEMSPEQMQIAVEDHLNEMGQMDSAVRRQMMLTQPLREINETPSGKARRIGGQLGEVFSRYGQAVKERVGQMPVAQAWERGDLPGMAKGLIVDPLVGLAEQYSVGGPVFRKQSPASAVINAVPLVGPSLAEATTQLAEDQPIEAAATLTADVLPIATGKPFAKAWGTAGKAALGIGPLESAGLSMAAKQGIPWLAGMGLQMLKDEGGSIRVDFALPTAQVLVNPKVKASGAAWLMDGFKSFRSWSNRMVQEYGSEIEPHLEALYAKSQQTVEDLVGATFKEKMPSVARLKDLWAKGEASKEWYQKAKAEVARIFGEEDAGLVLDFLAATSPNTAVSANFTQAMNALARYRSGVPFMQALLPGDLPGVGLKNFMPVHVTGLMQAVAGEELSGPKVNPFSKALKGDPNAIVVDVWMMRAFGFLGDNPTDAQRAYIENRINRLSKITGDAPREVQARIWEATRKQYENKGLVKPSVGAFDQLLGGKELYGVSYELVPGKGSFKERLFNDYYQLDYQQRAQLTRRAGIILSDIMNEYRSGAAERRAYVVQSTGGERAGAFEEYTNPSPTAQIVASREVIHEIMGKLGYRLNQKGIMGHRLIAQELAIGQMGTGLRIFAGADNARGQAFFNDPVAFGRFWDAFRQRVPELIGATPTSTNAGPAIDIFNLDMADPTNVKARRFTPQLMEKVNVVLNDLADAFDVDLKYGMMEIEPIYWENDWMQEGMKRGEEHLRRANPARSRSVDRRLATQLSRDLALEREDWQTVAGQEALKPQFALLGELFDQEAIAAWNEKLEAHSKRMETYLGEVATLPEGVKAPKKPRTPTGGPKKALPAEKILDIEPKFIPRVLRSMLNPGWWWERHGIAPDPDLVQAIDKRRIREVRIGLETTIYPGGTPVQGALPPATGTQVLETVRGLNERLRAVGQRARAMVAMPWDAGESFITQGRYKTQHEIARSQGMEDPVMRANVEHSHFGLPEKTLMPREGQPTFFGEWEGEGQRPELNPDLAVRPQMVTEDPGLGLSPEERPVSGFLNDTPWGHSSSDTAGEVSHYLGSRLTGVVIELKPRVKDRTTVTFTDSLDVGQFYPTPVNHPTISSVPGYRVQKLITNGVHQKAVSEVTPRDVAGTGYIEIQVHGGIQLERDVAAVHFASPPTDPRVLVKLQSLGIPYTVKMPMFINVRHEVSGWRGFGEGSGGSFPDPYAGNPFYRSLLEAGLERSAAADKPKVKQKEFRFTPLKRK